MILRDATMPTSARTACCSIRLDGSSNLDVRGAVGTIFSILRKDRRSSQLQSSLLQPGAEQVAAGYVLHGSSTVFVLTIGMGVDMFVLDPAYGAFMRVAQGVRIPKANKCYSVNEGNRLSFPRATRSISSRAQERGYSSRYAGAMVADVHRILLQGGVFSVSADPEGAQGQAAPDVRSQSHGHDRRTGRRQGAQRPGRAHLEVRPHRYSSARTGHYRQQRRSGPRSRAFVRSRALGAIQTDFAGPGYPHHPR